MKQLFIIRHGETDNNKAHIIQGRSLDASLNDVGRQQAKAISDALDDFKVEKIVASSLVRTHETAGPLLKKRGLPLEKYADLDEINFGDLEGEKFTEIKDRVMEVHDYWRSGDVDYAPEGGESPRQTFERANNQVLKVLASSSEENIVFMIHGRLIRILLSEWLGYGLKNMHKVEHQNGAINHLTWHDGAFKAIELNKTEHLLELV